MIKKIYNFNKKDYKNLWFMVQMSIYNLSIGDFKEFSKSIDWIKIYLKNS